MPPLTLRAALRATWPRWRGAVIAGVLASLTLGLAPYYPHAHVYKQLVNLWNGRLSAPIDRFDLVLHGAPWLFLAGALVAWTVAAARSRRAPS